MTLTDFLLARIAEDEAVARAATPGPWAISGRELRAPAPHNGFLLGTWANPADQTFAIRHAPTRVLAECEAKRRIVEEHPLVTDPARLVPVWTGATPGVACETCGGNPADSTVPLEDIGPCETLAALALPYADHSDYREEWRP